AVAGARFEKPLLRAIDRTLEVEAPSQSEALTRLAEAVSSPATENPPSGRIGALELSPPFARPQPQPQPVSSAAGPRPAAAPATSVPASAADRGQPGWLS